MKRPNIYSKPLGVVRVENYHPSELNGQYVKDLNEYIDFLEKKTLQDSVETNLTAEEFVLLEKLEENYLYQGHPTDKWFYSEGDMAIFAERFHNAKLKILNNQKVVDVNQKVVDVNQKVVDVNQKVVDVNNFICPLCKSNQNIDYGSELRECQNCGKYFKGK